MGRKHCTDEQIPFALRHFQNQVSLIAVSVKGEKDE